MWFLLAAHAQDCGIRTAVAGFPLGTVPEGVVSTVVLESACALSAGVTVYDGEQAVYRADVQPEREGDFHLFRFQVDQAPTDVDLLFELEVRDQGEPLRYVGGWYLVDPTLEEDMVGRPQLADVVVEHRGDQVVLTAAVLPATTAPEAMFLWRVDGELLQATVSTQPRPELVIDAGTDRACIEVEELGVDGRRVVSEPRCVEVAARGCGCSSGSTGSLVGSLLRR